MSRQFAQQPKFTLDISRPGHTPKKFKCPHCNQKRFVRFVDAQTGIYLEEKYGRCDREEHCGYFMSPYQDAEKAPLLAPRAGAFHLAPKPLQEIKQVPKELVSATLQFYDTNNLIKFFYKALGVEHTQAILSRYFIGTAKGGAAIFWQIDKQMRCRTGARIFYNQETGKRFKDLPVKRLFTKGDGYQPCLFGEHLLYTISDKIPVVIVESEKTAAIASAYLPTISGFPVIWLACSGVNGIDEVKMQVLRGKEIILCPDFSFHARATWGLVKMRKRMNELGRAVPHPDGELIEDYISLAMSLKAQGCKVRFFDPAPEITDASDIADLLLAQGPPPPLFLPANLESLKLPGTAEPEITPLSNTVGPNLTEKSSGIHNTAPASFAGKSFRIEKSQEKGLFTISDSLDITDFLNGIINQDLMGELITGLGVSNGRIESPEEVEAFYAAAERARAEQLVRITTKRRSNYVQDEVLNYVVEDL